jgi:hypothetical protein
MIIARVDMKDVVRKVTNAAQYGGGFLDGIQMQRLEFNRFLGGVTVEALGKYIDARARGDHASLHHVYEPGETGNEGGRLYSFTVKPTLSVINIGGSFKQSTGTPLAGGEPFYDKARMMENGISVTIAPKNGDVISFEEDGEMVFTTESITIEHPGGDAVAGSFGRVVDDFFEFYFTNSILAPIMKDLASADEFASNFAAGVRGGRSVGVKAGRQYLQVSGLNIK